MDTASTPKPSPNEARMRPRLQFTPEEGTDIQAYNNQWDSSLHKKILALTERFTDEAMRHSQWHKRMNVQNLNQVGKVIAADALLPDAQVYFYKPPTQAEVINRTRMAKHLAH